MTCPRSQSGGTCRESNPRCSDHESDTLTTRPRRPIKIVLTSSNRNILFFPGYLPSSKLICGYVHDVSINKQCKVTYCSFRIQCSDQYKHCITFAPNKFSDVLTAAMDNKTAVHLSGFNGIDSKYSANAKDIKLDNKTQIN